MRFRALGPSLALTTLLALTAPAYAEAAPADGVAPDDAARNSGTQAQEDASRGDVIIVTARRRQETAQEVPLAISVIRGDSIESTGNFNVVKLQQLAPTLQVYASNPRNTAVNIRGLGVPFGLTSDGFEQGVGIYVDDVYNARVAAATFDFLDVEQVEVLRGPQGSLYGKNTTAGAINITTNQPTFDFEGRAEVTAANLSFKQAKAAISARYPIPSQHVSQHRPQAVAAQYSTRPATDISTNRTISACAARCCFGQMTTSISLYRAITADRTPNAAAPFLCALAKRSAHWRVNMRRLPQHKITKWFRATHSTA